MDFKMTQEDWIKVMSLFGKARDEYGQRKNQRKAAQCDETIALVQNITMEIAE